VARAKLYHGTAIDHLLGIAKRGLQPAQPSFGNPAAVYMTDMPEYAGEYAQMGGETRSVTGTQRAQRRLDRILHKASREAFKKGGPGGAAGPLKKLQLLDAPVGGPSLMTRLEAIEGVAFGSAGHPKLAAILEMPFDRAMKYLGGEQVSRLTRGMAQMEVTSILQNPANWKGGGAAMLRSQFAGAEEVFDQLTTSAQREVTQWQYIHRDFMQKGTRLTENKYMWKALKPRLKALDARQLRDIMHEGGMQELRLQKAVPPKELRALIHKKIRRPTKLTSMSLADLSSRPVARGKVRGLMGRAFKSKKGPLHQLRQGLVKGPKGLLPLLAVLVASGAFRGEGNEDTEVY
jgi:hypothetical protein